jgi:hypothetical protein
MKIGELEARLLEAGCNPINFSVRNRGSDVYCLEEQDGVWRVFYTERGQDEPPVFESTEEAEACDYYFHFITTRIRHYHLIGFLKSESGATVLEDELLSHGIRVHRDKIPYHGWADPRYRVFVIGRDIFKVREMFPEVPKKEE